MKTSMIILTHNQFHHNLAKAECISLGFLLE